MSESEEWYNVREVSFQGMTYKVNRPCKDPENKRCLVREIRIYPNIPVSENGKTAPFALVYAIRMTGKKISFAMGPLSEVPTRNN